MTDHPYSRVDVARRLAARLGTEPHPELLDLVPPVAWDEFPTRSELRDHTEHLERRLRAIRDALAVAHHDDVRRLMTWHLVTLVAVAALAVLVGRTRAPRDPASPGWDRSRRVPHPVPWSGPRVDG
jgi:hypothetical protein